MPHRLRTAAISLALLTCLLADAPARAGDTPAATDPSQPLAVSLRNLQMGDGIAADLVVLFPLYAPSGPALAEVSAGVRGASLVFSEPEPKFGRQTVRVANGGATTALVLAGTVVEGGRRDRMVRFDRLIPANDAIEVEVMPASMARDTRAQGKEFRIADFLAPSYLRESGQFSADTSAVPRFVSHFLEFRNPSDTRGSLLAIGDSAVLADACLTCQRSFAEWPATKGAATAVGGILVVRGRVQSMEVFATNDHLRAFFAPLLKSLAFPAAAIALRAKRLDIPVPGRDDPVGTLAAAKKASEDLLASLASATYERRKTDPAFSGEAWVLHLKDGARGTALVREGRLVHAAVYPGDPFEEALYSRPLNPLEPEDVSGGDSGNGVGKTELERVSARGARLTPAEQRLLDRMRERLPAPR